LSSTDPNQITFTKDDQWQKKLTRTVPVYAKKVLKKLLEAGRTTSLCAKDCELTREEFIEALDSMVTTPEEYVISPLFRVLRDVFPNFDEHIVDENTKVILTLTNHGENFMNPSKDSK